MNTLQSCRQSLEGLKPDSYDKYRKQYIVPKDELFILHTVKEWRKKDWAIYRDRSLSFKMSNDEIEYFIGGGFYSPDKLKMIVWVGDKEPNALAKNIYNTEDSTANRMCSNSPIGAMVYEMSALIGIRNDTNEFWQLYSFINQTAECFTKQEQVINVMEQYYFRDMKNHLMPHLIQSGVSKGRQEYKAYGFNIQDMHFWDSCWLWEKDTVGSNGLYPFQVVSYVSYPEPRCIKCAKEVLPPVIDYPEAIWNLYPRSKFLRDSLEDTTR